MFLEKLMPQVCSLSFGKRNAENGIFNSAIQRSVSTEMALCQTAFQLSSIPSTLCNSSTCTPALVTMNENPMVPALYESNTTPNQSALPTSSRCERVRVMLSLESN